MKLESLVNNMDKLNTSSEITLLLMWGGLFLGSSHVVASAMTRSNSQSREGAILGLIINQIPPHPSLHPSLHLILELASYGFGSVLWTFHTHIVDNAIDIN